MRSSLETFNIYKLDFNSYFIRMRHKVASIQYEEATKPVLLKLILTLTLQSTLLICRENHVQAISNSVLPNLKWLHWSQLRIPKISKKHY